MQQLNGSAVVAVGDCLISAWVGAITERDVDGHERLARTLVDVHAGFRLLVILREGLKMPTAEQRICLEGFYTRHAHALRGVANVVLGSGFWASGIRAVLTTSRLVVGKPYPMRVFSTTSDGVAWVAQQSPAVTFEPRALEQALGAARCYMGGSISLPPAARKA
jgi:hypothetical protein